MLWGSDSHAFIMVLLALMILILLSDRLCCWMRWLGSFFRIIPLSTQGLSRKELVRMILYIFGIYSPASKTSFMRSCLFSWVSCYVVQGEFVVWYLCSLVVFASEYLKVEQGKRYLRCNINLVFHWTQTGESRIMWKRKNQKIWLQFVPHQHPRQIPTYIIFWILLIKAEGHP